MRSCCVWMRFRCACPLYSCVCAYVLIRFSLTQRLVGLLGANDTRLVAASAHALGILAQNDNTVKTALHAQRGLAKLAQLLSLADAYAVTGLLSCFCVQAVSSVSAVCRCMRRPRLRLAVTWRAAALVPRARRSSAASAALRLCWRCYRMTTPRHRLWLRRQWGRVWPTTPMLPLPRRSVWYRCALRSRETCTGQTLSPSSCVL